MASQLFENAIASVRMGIEDFRQQDADRDISAVRNFYAGILLLAKEAIIRKAPHADPQLVIGAKFTLVPDGVGGAAMEKVGHSTIDFQQIAERAKSFGVSLDANALKNLNRIRNDLEHHYTSASSTAIREAISEGFPLVASLLRQLGEDPVDLLGECWSFMLTTKEVYDQELQAAQATLANVKWHSVSLSHAELFCTACKSKLLAQEDPDNEIQSHVEFRCMTCGCSPDLADVIESAISSVYAGEAYSRFKETFENGPIFNCPACERDTLIEDEGACANCEETLDYESECIRCSAGIGIQDYLDGLDSGLCSYCLNILSKDD
jgi:hypothetical protein